MRIGTLIGFMVVLVGAARVQADVPPVQFSAEPRVTLDATSARIEFAVNRETDVAVEILDETGDTVRHLAAGLLGPNAPEPLKADSLTQTLAWDRKDDLGQDAPAGNYFVRVGLGLKPALKKVENFAPLNAGAVLGLVGLPDGGVCVVNMAELRPRLIVVDRDGGYSRQLFPPPANLASDKLPAIRGFSRGDGRWVPMLSGVMAPPANSPAVCPLASGGGRVAIVPFGAAPVFLIDAATAAITGPIGGDSIGQGRSKLSPRAIALSPDGKWLYLTAVEVGPKDARPLHAVYRMPVDGSEPAKPLVGDPDKAGKTETLLSTPIGLAVDKAGNLLVCDNDADRVAVFSAEGKFVFAAAAKAPVLVTALPDGGCCVLSGLVAGGIRTFAMSGLKLLRLTADGKQVAADDLKLPVRLGKPCVTGLAVDSAKDPAVAVVSISGEAWPATGGALLRWDCRGEGLAALPAVPTNFRQPHTKGPYDARSVYNWGVADPNYPKYRELFDWKQLPDEGAPFCSFGPLDPRTGQWADGRIYSWNNWVWYHTKTSDMRFRRFGPDNKPIPFASTQSNELTPTHDQRSPWFAQRGTMVDRRGHIYMRYTWADAAAKAQRLNSRNCWVTGVLHFDPMGALIGEIALTHGTYGLGADVRGGIYVADKPRPAGVLVPADIEKAFGGKVPASISGWYGSVIKFPPTGGRFIFTDGAPVESDARRPGDLYKLPLKAMDADFNPSTAGRSTARLEGAQWVWVGISPMITTKACICYSTNLAVDPHGRTFAPDRIACRVAVLDAAGNLVRYIGSYGNMDSRGKDSPVPEPEIALAGVRMVTSATSRQVRVADGTNGWISVINLGYERDSRTPLVLK